jgi:hypothetical protein
VEDVFLAVRLVGDARVVAVPAVDRHLTRPESGLHPEGAPGAALAGEAVADRDRKGLTLDLQAKLAAVAGGFPSRHPRSR